MTAVFLLKNLLGTLLLPPANTLVLFGLAAILRKRRIATWLAVLGSALLLLQSLPVVSSALMASLEKRAGPPLTDPGNAQAIVVLGGGLNRAAPEYGGDTVNEHSLVRLRYGATLARRHHLPILVSGGRLPATERAEADAMAEALTREFGVDVRWREARSQDTADNARLSATQLRAEGITRVVLVTEAFHMPRARRLFAAAGLHVITAPTNFKERRRPLSALDWLPQASALHNTYYALHEWLGITWAALAAKVKPAR